MTRKDNKKVLSLVAQTSMLESLELTFEDLEISRLRANKTRQKKWAVSMLIKGKWYWAEAETLRSAILSVLLRIEEKKGKTNGDT